MHYQLKEHYGSPRLILAAATRLRPLVCPRTRSCPVCVPHSSTCCRRSRECIQRLFEQPLLHRRRSLPPPSQEISIGSDGHSTSTAQPSGEMSSLPEKPSISTTRRLAARFELQVKPSTSAKQASTEISPLPGSTLLSIKVLLLQGPISPHRISTFPAL